MIATMVDKSESVHVHHLDVSQTVEAYRKKGLVLKEKTDPTIIAQAGFVKLIFVPEEDLDSMPAAKPKNPKKRRGLFF